MQAATTELKPVLCPLWADAKTCKSLTGLPAPTLRRLADNGHIRRKKVGDAKQSGAVYKLADVLDWLEGSQ